MFQLCYARTNKEVNIDHTVVLCSISNACEKYNIIQTYRDSRNAMVVRKSQFENCGSATVEYRSPDNEKSRQLAEKQPFAQAPIQARLVTYSNSACWNQGKPAFTTARVSAVNSSTVLSVVSIGG